MACERASVPLVGPWREPQTHTGTTCREVHEIEGFSFLEALRAEARATRQSICRVGTARKGGDPGGSPGPSQGWGAGAQQDGRVPACGLNVSELHGHEKGELCWAGRPG